MDFFVLLYMYIYSFEGGYMKKKSKFYLLKRFIPYYKKYKWILFLDLLCASLTTVCEIVLPLIVALTFKFLPISETVYICSVISAAMPLGLNILIIPSAYGQDTTVPASMALMAFLFACITIPIVFAVVF